MTQDLPGFRKHLLDWYRRVRRDLPWRRTKNPYAIWVSEIMLQQTRVAAVIPYYERFLNRFPTVQSLASAEEPEVLSLWAGLGYYSRARNLQKAARQVTNNGFPRTFDEIRELTGIGDYTAAAVASIAFHEPHAAVDGNVLRVFARLGNDASDIGAPSVRKRLAVKAQTALDPKHPGDWNQAVMELGATVCTPRNPQCGECPVKGWCSSNAAGTQNQLPVKIRPNKRVEIELTLLVIRRPVDNAILMQQRPVESGQLASFWELPTSDQLPKAAIDKVAHSFTHQITHHRYSYQVVSAKWTGRKTPPVFRWILPADLASIPLTTASRKALRGILVDNG